MIKPSLQLRVGQQLSMTPQLQQAIRLLQMSTLDLQEEIQTVLDSNPLLERVDDGIEGHINDEGEFTEDGPLPDELIEQPSNPSARDESDWADNTLPDELPVDTDWDSLLNSAGHSQDSHHDPDDEPFAQTRPARETLHDHLHWQLNLTPLSERDHHIALTLIDSIGDNGLLSQNLDDIHEGLNTELAELERDEIEAVLHQIQNFDPPGIAARDLRECLLIQLRQLPADTPLRAAAIHLVGEHLDSLGNHDLRSLARRTGLSEADIEGVMQLLRRLNPTPGDTLASDDIEYIVPDVFVRKDGQRWRVELNPDIAPRLRINSHYASLIRRADSSSDNTFLRNNLQEARWFLKSLRSRNETLIRVAGKIVEHQQGFLERGEEAMKPLILHDIAEVLDLHESTISRATTRKYMHTPRGVFELKYFFSSHVTNADGDEHSATAIRALIRKLVSSEDPRRPLSDNRITDLLAEQGVVVARRTVAKYRESLGIAGSSERKRLV